MCVIHVKLLFETFYICCSSQSRIYYYFYWIPSLNTYYIKSTWSAPMPTYPFSYLSSFSSKCHELATKSPIANISIELIRASEISVHREMRVLSIEMIEMNIFFSVDFFFSYLRMFVWEQCFLYVNIGLVGFFCCWCCYCTKFVKFK